MRYTYLMDPYICVHQCTSEYNANAFNEFLKINSIEKNISNMKNQSANNE